MRFLFIVTDFELPIIASFSTQDPALLDGAPPTEVLTTVTVGYGVAASSRSRCSPMEGDHGERLRAVQLLRNQPVPPVQAVGKWRRYVGEGAYIVLSLVAKTALMWQVYFGTVR